MGCFYCAELMSEVKIEVQPTPNPNALKFALDRPSTDGAPCTFRSAEDAGENAVAKQLLSIKGVVLVFMTANFISINKSAEMEWDAIVPEATKIIQDGY